MKKKTRQGSFVSTVFCSNARLYRARGSIEFLRHCWTKRNVRNREGKRVASRNSRGRPQVVRISSRIHFSEVPGVVGRANRSFVWPRLNSALCLWQTHREILTKSNLQLAHFADKMPGRSDGGFPTRCFRVHRESAPAIDAILDVLIFPRPSSKRKK